MLDAEANQAGAVVKEGDRVRECGNLIGVSEHHVNQQAEQAWEVQSRAAAALKLSEDDPDLAFSRQEQEAAEETFHSKKDKAFHIENAKRKMADKGKHTAVLNYIANTLEVFGVDAAWRAAISMLGYFDTEFAVSRSIETLAKGTLGKALSMLPTLEKYRPRLIGQRLNDEHLIKAIFGEAVDDDLAKQAAKEWAGWTDFALGLINKTHGYRVFKRDKEWRIPQHHPEAALLSMGKDVEEAKANWVALIRDKVLDPDGNPIDDEVLERIWTRIVSSDSRKPTPIILRQRYFRFKTAADWLEYHRKVGVDDVYSVMLNNVQSVAYRTALADIMGSDIDRLARGIKELIKGDGTGLAKAKHFENMLHSLTGQSNKYFVPNVMTAKNDGITNLNRKTPRSVKVARHVLQWRGVVGAIGLKNAVFSVPAELSVHMMRAGFWHMPTLRVFGNLMKTLTSDKQLLKKDLAAMGMFVDSMIHQAQAITRHTGEMFEHGYINRLGNTFLRSTGFTYAVDMMKASWQLGLLSHVSNHLGTHYDDLPTQMVVQMRKHGIGRRMWENTRRAYQGGARTMTKWGSEELDLLDPSKLDLDMSIRWQGVLAREGDAAGGNANMVSEAIIGQGYQRGTLPREILETSGMFMRWPITVLLFNFLPMFRMENVRDKTSLIASTTIVAATLGWANYQIRAAIAGRDDKVGFPDDGAMAREQMLAALTYGGVGGILGDFFFADDNFTRGLSPIASLASSPAWEVLDEVRRGGHNGIDSGLDTLYGEDKAEEDRINWERFAYNGSPAWWFTAVMKRALAEQLTVSHPRPDLTPQEYWDSLQR